ncbi:hypothetical protein L6164_026159 [Bauhinia variegata]|uniref:Uncharacterized protein n=1 Tax=Bauhinia variegata TaxID=167791 RepID=A0ACB9LP69_BAUVA|nr:hypothetical protein L6164_026159 [Bauhinia variegata]
METKMDSKLSGDRDLIYQQKIEKSLEEIKSLLEKVLSKVLGVEVKREESQIISKEESYGVVGASVLGGVDENPDPAQEVENLEESIGVACEFRKSLVGEAEVIVNQNVNKKGKEIRSVHPDGIDSECIGDEVLPTEFYHMKIDQLEGSDRSGGRKVSGFNTDGEIGASKTGGMVDLNSGLKHNANHNCSHDGGGGPRGSDQISIDKANFNNISMTNLLEELGMLSNVDTDVGIGADGPIIDNAGGGVADMTGHADIGVSSPCSATNINPLKGHAESPNIKDPNLSPSCPDIETSSHRQPLADIIAGLVNTFGIENARTQPQTNPNSIATRSDDDTQLATYYNSGTQCIRGVVNQTGYVKGDTNGVINSGTMGYSAITQNNQSVTALTAMVEGLQGLIGLVDRMDDGRVENDSATQLNSSCPNHRLDNYVNTGRQTIKGLINQIGIIKGNFNGLVNLGSVIYASSNN